MKIETPRVDRPSMRIAYLLALEQESAAWQILHALRRSDPGYAAAVSAWQAAADRIGVEAEALLKMRAADRNAISAPPARLNRQVFVRQPDSGRRAS